MLKTKREEKYQAALHRRLVINYSVEDFFTLMKANAELIMAERGEFSDFIIDDRNGPFLVELHKYSVMDKSFIGNPFLGIALIGGYGCGKSLIMEAYSRVVNQFLESNQIVAHRMQFKTSTELYAQAKAGITNELVFVPTVIDEIGREPKTAKEYGNESAPLTDLLFERHRKGIVTHATGNFKLETLSSGEMYGKMLGDRMKQMFNFIEMKGGSRR